MVTGAAQKRYEINGISYSFVVKPGTITFQSADVLSYAEDESNTATELFFSQHLAHWGIIKEPQEKAERTIAELHTDPKLQL